MVPCRSIPMDIAAIILVCKLHSERYWVVGSKSFTTSAPIAHERVPFAAEATAAAILIGAAAGVVTPGAGPSLATAFVLAAVNHNNNNNNNNNTVEVITAVAHHVNKIIVPRANVEDPSQVTLHLSNTSSIRSFECKNWRMEVCG